MRIERQFTQRTVTIEAGDAESEEFYFAPYVFLSVEMPAVWTAAKIGFKVARTSGGTFVPLYDNGGTLVEINPAVDQMHVAPAEIAGQMYVKLWSQDAGSDENQVGADRVLGLILKG